MRSLDCDGTFILMSPKASYQPEWSLFNFFRLSRTPSRRHQPNNSKRRARENLREHATQVNLNLSFICDAFKNSNFRFQSSKRRAKINMVRGLWNRETEIVDEDLRWQNLWEHSVRKSGAFLSLPQYFAISGQSCRQGRRGTHRRQNLFTTGPPALCNNKYILRNKYSLSYLIYK